MIMTYCAKCQAERNLMIFEDMEISECSFCNEISECYNPFYAGHEEPEEPNFNRMRVEITLQRQMEVEHMRMVGLLVRYQTFFDDMNDIVGHQAITHRDEELFNEAHNLLQKVTGRS